MNRVFNRVSYPGREPGFTALIKERDMVVSELGLEKTLAGHSHRVAQARADLAWSELCRLAVENPGESVLDAGVDLFDTFLDSMIDAHTYRRHVSRCDELLRWVWEESSTTVEEETVVAGLIAQWEHEIHTENSEVSR